MKRLAYYALLGALSWFASYAAHSAEIKAPERVVAGSEVSLTTTGGGEATFYLFGPSHVSKRQVRLGEAVKLEADEVRASGRYLAIIRAGEASASAHFFVAPAAPANVNFLARPSRVPAAKPGVISGTAFVFDKYNNLVLEPTTVKFDLALTDAAAVSRTVPAKNGIAWARLDSGRKAGAAQFTASVDDTFVRRVVQQTASEPCNLHLKAEPSKNGIRVETDPVRDCAGNPVPDGTIVTFTAVEPAGGRSTVDARIKRGIAQAELPVSEGATLSVAAGVVVGNEIRWGGGR
jgi:hypothetical protein